MMTRTVVAVLLGGLFVQSPPRPTFEVASIKPVDSIGEVFSSFRVLPGGRFEGVAPIHNWIAYAFGSGTMLRSSQIINLPSRIGSLVFRITAKAGDEEPPDFAKAVFPMLRTLLEDRFKLVTHAETRSLPAYALTVRNAGRLGPRIRRSTVDCEARKANPTPAAPRCGFEFTATGLTVIGQSMSNIATLVGTTAAMLRNALGRRVVDRTNLDGTFDLELEWDPLVENAIFTLVQEQLGLKLEPAQEPGTVVVIDHVEPPTPD